MLTPPYHTPPHLSIIHQACMGAGFVAGPALSLLGSRVYGLDTRGVRYKYNMKMCVYV